MSRKQRIQRKIALCNDSVAAEVLADAEAVLTAAKAAKRGAVNPSERKAANEALVDAEATVESAQAEVDAAGYTTFRVQSIGRRVWEELIESHPPTAEQRAQASEKEMGVPAWNVDSFPAALLGLSVALLDDSEDEDVWVELSEEDAQELWDSDAMNAAELQLLFQTAVEVNQLHRVADLKKGSKRSRG